MDYKQKLGNYEKNIIRKSRHIYNDLGIKLSFWHWVIIIAFLTPLFLVLINELLKRLINLNLGIYIIEINSTEFYSILRALGQSLAAIFAIFFALVFFIIQMQVSNNASPPKTFRWFLSPIFLFITLFLIGSIATEFLLIGLANSSKNYNFNIFWPATLFIFNLVILILYTRTSLLDIFKSSIQEELRIGSKRQNLEKLDLSKMNLEKANLEAKNLIGSNLNNSNLSKANLKNAKLKGANLHLATLSGADLTNAVIPNADLSKATIIGKTKFIGACLVNADLSNAIMNEADFTAANCENATFDGAILNGGIFDEAVLIDASFHKTKLIGSKFLQGALLTGADLSFGDLSDAQLIGAGLIGARFIGATIKSANFEEADLNGANLKGVNYDDSAARSICKAKNFDTIIADDSLKSDLKRYS